MKQEVVCYHSTEEFLTFLKGFDVSQDPYLSYSFLSVFFMFSPKGNYYFFNILEDGKLIGVVPFECTFESQLLSIKKFRFIGYRVFNYEQYICEDKDMQKVHDILMRYFEKQKYSVVLNIYDVNNVSPFYQVLQREERKHTSYSLYYCPYLYFSDNFDVFYKTVYASSKKRAELNKFQKRVAGLGDLKIINVDNREGYETNLHYINQIYKVHSERFAKVYATNFFSSENKRPYYSELIKSLMYGEKGFLSLMILDEVVIAFIFCLTNGSVLIDWIPAFDPAFAKYNLGIVQYKMLFEEMCNQKKYKLFDYSKGMSVYKSKWAKEQTVNYQFIINLGHKNPFAYILYSIDRCKFLIKIYLRKKGVLKWAKIKMGEFLAYNNKRHEDISPLKVVIKENYEGELFKLKYSVINNYPVETREAVLSAIYQQKKVVSVSKNEVVLAL